MCRWIVSDARMENGFGRELSKSWLLEMMFICETYGEANLRSFEAEAAKFRQS